MPPTAKFNNKEIYRQIDRLQHGASVNALSRWFGGANSDKSYPALGVPPILNPIERPHADDWLEHRVDRASPDFDDMKALIESVFAEKSSADLYGIALHDFAASIQQKMSG